MKKCTFKEGLQITASTIEAAKIVATELKQGMKAAASAK